MQRRPLNDKEIEKKNCEAYGHGGLPPETPRAEAEPPQMKRGHGMPIVRNLSPAEKVAEEIRVALGRCLGIVEKGKAPRPIAFVETVRNVCQKNDKREKCGVCGKTILSGEAFYELDVHEYGAMRNSKVVCSSCRDTIDEKAFA